MENELVLASLLVFNFLALNALNKIYDHHLDRINSATITLAHEEFYSGCIEGRLNAEQSFVYDCREITTKNAIDKVLFVK